MELLLHKRGWQHSTEDSIYIPIWSYFYHTNIEFMIILLSNLHSNMELLLLKVAVDIVRAIIDLHSNMELLLLTLI